MSSTYRYGAHVHANGIRQHYLRYGGSGQQLILVPGITSPAATWGFVAERLGRHFDVHVLDVRGRGLSESGDALDYSREACAEDVAAFADALDLRDCVYLGHSMGARIGCKVGRDHPGRFASMILVDPPVSGPGRRPYPAQLPWYIDSIRIATRGAGVEEMRAFCPTWSEAHLRTRAQWLHTCHEEAIRRSFRGINEDDIHSDMDHLRMPVMLMVAGRGGVIEAADIDEIRQRIPQVHVRVVPGAGHMIPYEDEEDFFLALGEFLGVRC